MVGLVHYGSGARPGEFGEFVKGAAMEDIKRSIERMDRLHASLV